MKKDTVNVNIFETDQLPFGLMVQVDGICYIGTNIESKKKVA